MLCTNYGRLQEETSCVGQNRGVAIMKKNIWLAVIKKREWIEGMCEGLE